MATHPEREGEAGSRRKASGQWALLAALAMVAFGCDDGGGGSASGSCLTVFFPTGGSACAACWETSCPAAVATVERGCSGALACVCRDGTYDPAAAESTTCSEQLAQASCVATMPSATGCPACENACTTSGGTSSGGAIGGKSPPGGGAGYDGGGGYRRGGGEDASVSFGDDSGGGSGFDAAGECGTVCSNTDTCSNGSPVKLCSDSVNLCWDTCYVLIGSQRVDCASCSDTDVGNCVIAAEKSSLCAG
jgi:hypothetical protein